MVVQESCPVAMAIDELVKETDGQVTVQKGKEGMRNKQWKHFLQDVITLNPVNQAAMSQILQVCD